MSNLYLQSYQKFQIDINFHQKKSMNNFHYDMGIKSRHGSQIFPSLAISVACKLQIISRSELAV